jgi:hypothetical protein
MSYGGATNRTPYRPFAPCARDDSGNRSVQRAHAMTSERPPMEALQAHTSAEAPGYTVSGILAFLVGRDGG